MKYYTLKMLLVFLHILQFSVFQGVSSYKNFPHSTFRRSLGDLYSSSFFHRVQRAMETQDDNPTKDSKTLPLELMSLNLQPGHRDFDWLSKADLVHFEQNYTLAFSHL